MRIRICKNCGNVFEKPSGSSAYLCAECSQKSKDNNLIRECTCKMCGITFIGHPSSRYCPECSEERKKQLRKIRNQKKPDRPLGSMDICQACGKEYIVKSGRQKYCPECAEEQIAKNIKAHKKEYRIKNQDKIREQKKNHLGQRYVCVICGKEFEKHNTTVTCSSACFKEYKRIKQNEADIRRGKRNIPADQRYDSGLPKSGVVGVTWHRNCKKWQATYKTKYLGLYESIDQAAEAIEEFKKSNKH